MPITSFGANTRQRHHSRNIYGYRPLSSGAREKLKWLINLSGMDPGTKPRKEMLFGQILNENCKEQLHSQTKCLRMQSPFQETKVTVSTYSEQAVEVHIALSRLTSNLAPDTVFTPLDRVTSRLYINHRYKAKAIPMVFSLSF